MKTCSSIALPVFAALLVTMVMQVSAANPPPVAFSAPDAAPSGARIMEAAFFYSDATSSAVDCIGNGAVCDGRIEGSNGYVSVTGNNDRHHYWRFKLTCDFGGDQYSGFYEPSPGTVTSHLTCQFGALAKYWNVLVDYRP